MLFVPWSWQLWHSLWPPSLTTWQLFQCDTSINSFSPHLTQQPLVLTLLSAQWLGEHKYEFYVNDVWPLTARTITHWVTNVMCWQLLTAAWLLCSVLSVWCSSLCVCVLPYQTPLVCLLLTLSKVISLYPDLLLYLPCPGITYSTKYTGVHPPGIWFPSLSLTSNTIVLCSMCVSLSLMGLFLTTVIEPLRRSSLWRV